MVPVSGKGFDQAQDMAAARAGLQQSQVRACWLLCCVQLLFSLCILLAHILRGDLLAQLVEHRIPVPKVGGSSPP